VSRIIFLFFSTAGSAALRHLRLRASASLPLLRASVTVALANKPQQHPEGRAMGLPREVPVFLIEYFVYALGAVILCVLLAAFYFIDAPVNFRRFW
jgi:hypothetical protein